MTATSWPAFITRPLPAVAPSRGCTFCGRPDTATVDAVHGRRCADHAPRFDPAHAVHLMVTGWPATAFAYCRVGLP
jgi:hypothetical protein